VELKWHGMKGPDSEAAEDILIRSGVSFVIHISIGVRDWMNDRTHWRDPRKHYTVSNDEPLESLKRRLEAERAIKALSISGQSSDPLYTHISRNPEDIFSNMKSPGEA